VWDVKKIDSVHLSYVASRPFLERERERKLIATFVLKWRLLLLIGNVKVMGTVLRRSGELT